MLYKEYDDATLRRLQKCELLILQDFIELCKKHDIEYFMIGGSAIGAIRHGGFIPWDDDIDIALTRENYEKFLVVAKELEDYEILNAVNDENYPLMTSRMCRKGTTFREEVFKDLPCNMGIFLDIFCFDYVSDDDSQMKRQGWEAWFWNKLVILHSIARPTLYFGGWKAKLVYFICFFVHYGLRILPIKPTVYYNLAKKAAMRYGNKPTKRLAHFFEPTPFCSVCLTEDILPPTTMMYEGIEVAVPHNIDHYLKVRYGDYMKLPPEDKRHNHPPYDLEFGDFGKDA